ncbi:hypothetical protein BJ742DRAFT_76341 [Cladochytrium replicatum]|nr:hypothetical protein BJ742DRAFT_76341 [Cladochytrium replicatum]
MFLSKNDILGHDILNSVLVYLASWLTENTAERVLTLCRQAMTLTWIYHAVKQFKLLNIKGVDERTVQIVDKLICSYLWHPDIEPDFLVQIVCVAGMHVTLYEQSCLYKCENLKRIITSFHHVNRKVRDAFINLYGKLNPILTLSVSHFTDRSTDTVKFEMYSSPYTGAFREKQFMLAMDCLGIMPLSTPTDNAFEGSEELFSNKVLEFMSNPSQMLDQLERLYHACQLNQCFELFSQTEGNELSDDVLFKWASWECSRYCTLSRLRTPFGGPVQTLETIEWSLSSWMAVMDSLENSIEEDIEEKRVQLKVE